MIWRTWNEEICNRSIENCMAINRKGDYMEHIVQFAISIDDDRIKRNIENSVEKQVTNKIKGDCMKALVGKKSITNCDYTQKLKEMVDDNIQNFLAENKDEIIKISADKLSEKLSRTKAVKEAINKSIEEFL